MDDLFKLEGRIHKLEIHEGELNTLGVGGDSQVIGSSILSGVAESISLGEQSVFFASQSRLHVQSIVMALDGKVCIGQFHRALFEENEYVICIVKKLENNLYRLYSVLAPRTGLLHMQVGMGASIRLYKKSAFKGINILYIITLIIFLGAFYLLGNYSLINVLIWGGVAIVFYFICLLIVLNIIKSTIHFSEKSEKIFELYGFENPKETYLLAGRHYSNTYKILLESVFDYRKVIKDDPYPESYIEEKERVSHG